jgi:hypothetical protein
MNFSSNNYYPSLRLVSQLQLQLQLHSDVNVSKFMTHNYNYSCNNNSNNLSPLSHIYCRSQKEETVQFHEKNLNFDNDKIVHRHD